MIGIVGKIKVSYSVSGEYYEEIIDIMENKDFPLSDCPGVRFKIEEITYIEDTIYGVVLSLLEPSFKEDEYIVDNSVTFSVDELNVKGTLSLTF